MTRKYNVEQLNDYTYIWYEENGFRYSFGTDSANSDYQEYLKSLDEANSL